MTIVENIVRGPFRYRAAAAMVMKRMIEKNGNNLTIQAKTIRSKSLNQSEFEYWVVRKKPQ